MHLVFQLKFWEKACHINLCLNLHNSINKLDKTVTYPSLEIMSLGGGMPMQFACVQVALVRELDLKRADDNSSPVIHR